MGLTQQNSLFGSVHPRGKPKAGISDQTCKDTSTTRVLISSQMSTKQNYSRMVNPEPIVDHAAKSWSLPASFKRRSGKFRPDLDKGRLEASTGSGTPANESSTMREALQFCLLNQKRFAKPLLNYRLQMKQCGCN